MPWIKMPDGTAMHVKMAAPPRRRCVGCGRLFRRETMRQCDARLKPKRGRKKTECNAFICTGCTHVPAPDKDLCPRHAAQWKARLAAQGANNASPNRAAAAPVQARAGDAEDATADLFAADV